MSKKRKEKEGGEGRVNVRSERWREKRKGVREGGKCDRRK